MVWGALHAYYVPGFRNRLSLRVTWIWSWVTRRRAALLLIGETQMPDEPLEALQAPLEAEGSSPRRNLPWGDP